MNQISVLVILYGTVVTPTVGFGFEQFQAGLNAVKQLTQIGGEIKKVFDLYNSFNKEDKCKDSISIELAEAFLTQIKSIAEQMNQLTDATVAEPTCPEEVANGVYPLQPAYTIISPFRAYCEKGGWIVIHRRFHGQLNFDRTWREYQEGFGDIQDEFWLGLEKLHQLTRTGPYELKVVLKGFGGVEKWSKFDGFRVAGEFEQYRLDLGKLVAGNAGDSLYWHDGMKFSTPDRDNDTGDKHCAQLYNSGWWFKQCFDTNLNGLYGKGVSHYRMSWFTFDRMHKGLKEARMMIRPVQACEQRVPLFGSMFQNKTCN